MKLNHLNLTVADLDRSAAFYREQFGFEVAFPVEDDNGLLLKGPGDTVLVLVRGTPPADPGQIFHFGFGAGSAAEVQEARTRLAAAGCAELEWVEVDDYVSVKIADPDGYVVEVFWE